MYTCTAGASYSVIPSTMFRLKAIQNSFNVKIQTKKKHNTVTQNNKQKQIAIRFFLRLQNDSATCVFWKPETNQKNWKSDGCFRVKKRTAESDRLICECDHLTAFAVMDISRNIVSF